MKFHISGKIGVPVGIVLLIIGVLIAVSAIEMWEKSDDIETFMSEPGTEFVQEFIDEGEDGSAGWYLMIQGEYFVDNNDDNITDACDGLNITITDSQGNDMNSTSGTIYCELDDNRKLAGQDEKNVDINDGWMIVGIVCDTLDNAEMNGYWYSWSESGETKTTWTQTSENDRCSIGEKYTISSNQEMILFDRHTQEELEEEGLWTLICGICCSCLALILVVVSVISGFSMNPSTSAITTMEFDGGSVAPIPTDGSAVTVPGTIPGAIFGAGPTAQAADTPATDGDAEEIQSSADSLKEQFLAAASDKVAAADEPEKE